MDYIDASGCPRNYGEGFVDTSGVHRNPGEGFVDYTGVFRNPGEGFVDKSGYMRYPGEGFVDGEGYWREPKSSLRYTELTQEKDTVENNITYDNINTSSYPSISRDFDWANIIYKVFKIVITLNILTILFPLNPIVTLVLNILKKKKQKPSSSFKFALFLSKVMFIEWIIVVIIAMCVIFSQKNGCIPDVDFGEIINRLK